VLTYSLLPGSTTECKPTHSCNFRHTAVSFLACKGVRLASEKAHDKKHRNAAARYLPDSCWDHYPLSRWNRRNRDGSSGARHRHFDFSRQVINGVAKFAVATALWAVMAEREQKGRHKLQRPNGA
jgi:hypothetical protein